MTTDGNRHRKTSTVTESVSSVLKSTGMLTALGGFTTWLMSYAFERRTGLDYAWFSRATIENLGAMLLATVIDFFEVLSSPLILIGTALCLAGVAYAYKTRRGRRRGGQWSERLLNESTRSRLAIAIAATLWIAYVLPSMKFEDQLTSSPLYTLNTPVSGYDIVTRIFHSQQRLQVCAAVGELTAKLALHHIACSGPAFDAPQVAASKLRTIYLGYIVGVAIVIVLAFPGVLRLTRVLIGYSDSKVLKWSALSIASTVAGLSTLLAAPWIYVMIRAELAPRFGMIAGTACRGYRISAAHGRVVLYDPVQPKGNYEFDAGLFKPVEGPRSNALSAFLAEQLANQDLSGYETCSPSKGSGKQ